MEIHINLNPVLMFHNLLGFQVCLLKRICGKRQDMNTKGVSLTRARHKQGRQVITEDCSELCTLKPP